MLKKIFSLLSLNSSEKYLHQAVRNIIGASPSNLHLYRLAFRHISSVSGNETNNKNSNERLEFLGDAILGMITAEYLFKKYPYKDEGFLTQVRSRIVSRESLK